MYTKVLFNLKKGEIYLFKGPEDVTTYEVIKGAYVTQKDKNTQNLLNGIMYEVEDKDGNSGRILYEENREESAFSEEVLIFDVANSVCTIYYGSSTIL